MLNSHKDPALVLGRAEGTEKSRVWENCSQGVFYEIGVNKNNKKKRIIDPLHTEQNKL